MSLSESHRPCTCHVHKISPRSTPVDDPKSHLVIHCLDRQALIGLPTMPNSFDASLRLVVGAQQRSTPSL
eukprot:6185505-Pleurochrysis_carterae.AAC.2